MAKTYSAPYRDDSKHQPLNKGKQIGAIRIAVVTYEHEPINLAKDGETSYTIGAMVDSYISDRINNGNMVSEVTLFFETQEQQTALADLYRPRLND